jgi:hypothetical protein
MQVSSKVMFSTYNYYSSPAKGDIGTALFNGSAITPHAGVRTTYTNAMTPPSPLISPDAKPLFFKNAAGLNRALVASINWGSSTCDFLVYQADEDDTGLHVWGDPVYGPQTWTVGGTPISNPYRIQTTAPQTIDGVTFNYLYGINFDQAIVFYVKSSGPNGDTYELQTTKFTMPPPIGNDTYGVDLQIINDNGNTTIYALFINCNNIMSPSTAVYLNSTVVKLNTSLSTPGYERLPRTA